jgi:hypothetical protein
MNKSITIGGDSKGQKVKTMVAAPKESRSNLHTVPLILVTQQENRMGVDQSRPEKKCSKKVSTPMELKGKTDGNGDSMRCSAV